MVVSHQHIHPTGCQHSWNINTLGPRQKGGHFADDIFKCIFLNENVWISLEISLKFVPKVRIYNIPSLVLIMAWRRPGDKPLSEPMMVSLPTHMCHLTSMSYDYITFMLYNTVRQFVTISQIGKIFFMQFSCNWEIILILDLHNSSQCKPVLLSALWNKNSPLLISSDAQVGCDLPRPYVISADATCNHEGSSTHTTGFDRRCVDHKMEAFSCYDLGYDCRQTSNIRHTSVGNELVDHSDVVGTCRCCSQLHLHSSLNTWLQWIGQRQLQDEMRNI